MHDEHETRGNVFIGAGVTFQGEIKAPENAVICGTVNGKIDAKKILVLAKAVVSGESIADEIDVKGELINTVKCKGTLVVSSTGKVKGDINYEDVVIERGGRLIGRINSK